MFLSGQTQQALLECSPPVGVGLRLMGVCVAFLGVARLLRVTSPSHLWAVIEFLDMH